MTEPKMHGLEGCNTSPPEARPSRSLERWELEDLAERAAILEFEAGLSRGDAEREARRMLGL